MLNSVEKKKKKDDRQIEVSLQLKEWWKYVEEDTKPHFPPPDAMLNYIKAKPILPKPDRNGKLPTPNQLAYLIGRKISEVGTTGTHDLGNTLEEVNKISSEKIEEATLEDVNDDVISIILFNRSFK